MISVVSSLIASAYDVSDGEVSVRNPGRYLIATTAERERLEELGRPHIQLPDLVAVLTLMSDASGPFPYRLTCALVHPEGEVAGGLLSNDYTWADGKRFDRVTVRLTGQIPFFETGGVYSVRFLCDGVPLCDMPLPIFWEDDLTTAAEESQLAS